MRVAFRVDASTQMGIGHAKRCRALATAVLALRESEVLFITREFDRSAKHLLEPYRVIVLPRPQGTVPQLRDGEPVHAAWAGVTWSEDAAQTIECVASFRPDWLVVDHYAFDARWHGLVRDAVGARLAAIDDVADRPMDVEILVDQNLSVNHRTKYVGRLPSAARLLGGPAFALLDPVYQDAPRYRFSPKVGSVGIFMGGTDGGNVTPRALKACRASGFGGPIEIVSTSANPRVGELHALCASDGMCELQLDLRDLAAFFARHDLQIGAGGGACWERCCMGAPSLLQAVADNQIPVVRGLRTHGAAVVMEATDIDDASLSAAIRTLIRDSALRARLSDAARALVDGLGAERVAAELSNA